jgi:hypothetical protein
MIDRKPPELFVERPVTSMAGSRRSIRLPGGARRILWGAILLVLAGGIGLYAKFSGREDARPLDIPTITAEGMVKERPEQPGGIDIPHQDEMVFRQIDGDDGAGRPVVEHLLPLPEAPQVSAEPVAPAAAPEPAGVTETSQPVAPLPEDKVEDTATAPVAIPTMVAQEPAVAKAVAVDPVEAKSTSAPAPVPPSVAVEPRPSKPLIVGHLPADLFTGRTEPGAAGGKGWLAQLSSSKDEKAAQTQAKSLQGKYGAALGNARLRVIRADLGAKGVYYRVQSEPLTEAQARDICAALLRQKAACIAMRL